MFQAEDDDLAQPPAKRSKQGSNSVNRTIRVNQISLDTTTFHTLNDQSTLFDAVAQGRIYQVEGIIIDDKKLAYKDSKGNTCLHIAVINGQLKIAEILLQHGIDVNAVNSNGMTPLYLLISQVIQYSSDKNALSNQYQLARLLIQANASPNIPVYDQKLQRNKMTALHTAVAFEQYVVMKIILNSQFIDINLQDGNKWNALDWAIERRHMKILSRLLIDYRWSNESILNAIGHVNFLLSERQENILLAMQKLLLQREQQKLPKPKCGMQWINKFSVVFGSNNPKKEIVIDSSKEHAYLASQNSFSPRRILNGDIERKDFPDNPVTASITFITSAKTYCPGQVIKRKKLTISLNFIDQCYISIEESDMAATSEEEIQGIKRRAALAPADIFKQAAAFKPLTPREIEEKFQAEVDNPEPSFKRLFYHGEQSLLDYLEQPNTVKQIVCELKNHDKFVSGSKIYGLILNIHSPYYPCENCEVAILGEQNAHQSPFLKQLALELQIIGCALPSFSPLRMLTQVSSDMAFHGEAITEQEHEAFYVDLRNNYTTLILTHDMSAFKPECTQFHASKLEC